jgi:hypothetical protein
MKSRNAALIGSVALFSALSAQASWLGDVRVEVRHRDSDVITNYDGSPIEANICDYNDFTVAFQFYKAGVTDVPGVSIWQNVNAQAQLVKDSTQTVIHSASVPVTTHYENNAFYSLLLRNINPDTVSQIDPEMQNHGTMATHLNVYMDGNLMLSLPINYSCTY